MLRSIRRLAITAVSVLLLVAGLQVAAEAKAVPRVSGLAVKGQNSCAATMRVQWKGVSGATYEVRWASAKSSLAAATPLSVRRHAMTAGPLAGGKTFFWRGEYGWDLNSRETLDTQLGVFEGFQPKLSESSRASDVA